MFYAIVLVNGKRIVASEGFKSKYELSKKVFAAQEKLHRHLAPADRKSVVFDIIERRE